MIKVFSLLYNLLFLPVLWLVFHFLALVDKKFHQGIEGRKKLFPQLKNEIAKKSLRKIHVWIHCASLGEYEQAKPIIAALQLQYSSLMIVVTFFSPSGYAHAQKNNDDVIHLYLPFDTIVNARRFYDLVHPDVALFMSYDLWWNHIRQMRKHNVQIVVANARLKVS